MLKEAKNIRQVPGDPPRRWFDDEYFDLIVWLEKDGSVWGFQLCYDRGYAPRAMTWTKEKGYTHSGIDDGEGNGGAHKESPILVQDGLFDPRGIGAKLAAAAGELPPEMLAFILLKIKDFKF
jgi:hypothetical protein